MSWQSYVDDHLMCALPHGGQLVAAALYGQEDGNCWAQSAEMPVITKSQLDGIIDAFDNPQTPLASNGLFLGDEKFMMVAGDPGAVVRGRQKENKEKGRKGRGCCIKKTGSALVFGIFEEPRPSANRKINYLRSSSTSDTWPDEQSVVRSWSPIECSDPRSTQRPALNAATLAQRSDPRSTQRPVLNAATRAQRSDPCSTQTDCNRQVESRQVQMMARLLGPASSAMAATIKMSILTLVFLLHLHAASSLSPASSLSQESSPLDTPRTNFLWRFLRSWQAAHHPPRTAAGAAKRPSLWLQYRRHLSGNPADANVDLASFTRYHGDGGPYSLTPGIDPTDHSLDDVATPFGRRRRLQEKKQKGPCTPLSEAKVIPVSSPSDINKRLQHPNSVTVILEVTRDLVLPKGLVFSGAFRCTIFRSAQGKRNFKVSLMGDKEPVIRVWNTSNVVILRLDFWLGVTARSGECELLLDTDIGRGNTCPTIHIWRSHNVQVAKGSFWGRIDVFRAMATRVDSMKGTGLTLFVKSPGVVRVAFSGYGPALLKSWVALTNNELYGVDQPIVLQNGAVGVIARNNYIHDFLFAGIRCGADVYNQGDCMLTTLSNNLIVASGRNMSGDHDAAGIYYCTHFFNPGMPGWCQCYTPTINNCAKKPGTYWEEMRINYYNSPVINQVPAQPCSDTPLFVAAYMLALSFASYQSMQRYGYDGSKALFFLRSAPSPCPLHTLRFSFRSRCGACVTSLAPSLVSIPLDPSLFPPQPRFRFPCSSLFPNLPRSPLRPVCHSSFPPISPLPLSPGVAVSTTPRFHSPPIPSPRLPFSPPPDFLSPSPSFPFARFPPFPRRPFSSGDIQQPNFLKRFVTTWRHWHRAVTSRSSTSTLLQHRRYLSADPAEAADVARVLRRRGGWWHDADGQAYVSTSGDETIQEVTDDVAEGIVSRRRRKLVAANATGPCTPLADAILITVTTEEDIAKRTQYPNKQTVILELANDITLSKGLVFDAAYRCTIFRSSAAKTNYKIAYMGDTEPLLLIANTSNVIILRINFWMGVTMRSPECTDFLYTDLGSGNTCPTIMLWRVHNTQVAKGFVYGRIDVLRAMSSRVDNMKVTGLPLFVKSPGVIRVSFSGYGPALLKSWVAITNNEAYGVDQPIILLNGAVGVLVRRNYIHDFLFAGIRCGADVHNQGDCMLTTISNNLIVASGRNMSGDQDAAGIYYCTHFFNPGNVAECNYIFNGDHCYYLDYVSSGIKIRGGACVNTFDGMKVNNGKWNVITDVIMKGTQNTPGWVACFTPTSNNCLTHSGQYWEKMRLKYYNSPAILQANPWFPTILRAATYSGKRTA
ncbi:unnamed protein product [Closterium sp. Yama58-4]|nr:unnamed protein product [Closterium sp. Yama58-4]